MTVPRARILDLMKVQCKIFSTTYNPERLRLGNKVLRQSLRGSAVTAYYPRKVYTTGQFIKEFAHLELIADDEVEEERLEHVNNVKARGKGAPKKTRTAAAQGGKKKK